MTTEVPFEERRNPIARMMEKEMYEFLANFQLSTEDPNYMQYADGITDLQEGEPIFYYKHVALKMRQQEKLTMYVDFAHLSSFQFNEPDFMNNCVQHFYKYEPDMRKGMTRFMANAAPEAQVANKKSYYQLAIYNLPQICKIRELKTYSLGRLMSIFGTVTRTTDAKPELIEGHFMCMECKNVVANVEQ